MSSSHKKNPLASSRHYDEVPPLVQITNIKPTTNSNSPISSFKNSLVRSEYLDGSELKDLSQKFPENQSQENQQKSS